MVSEPSASAVVEEPTARAGVHPELVDKHFGLHPVILVPERFPTGFPQEFVVRWEVRKKPRNHV